MNATEQARFDERYPALLRALKLQGMAAKTQEGYARAVRRAAAFFDRCGLQFFYRHVLDRPWNWERISKPPRLHVRGGKGDKDRYVPITEPLLLLLRRWWRTHSHPRLLFTNAVGTPERVRETAGTMDHGGVQAALKAASVCASPSTACATALARSDSGHMLELGVDLRELQTILGHTRPETTARYAHLTDVTAAQAREKQGRLLEGFVLPWRDRT